MRVLLCVALLSATTHAAAGGYPVSGEEWASPRSGARVLAWPGVQAAVRDWQSRERQLLVIQHADEEEAALRAIELRDWLVALGLPPAALRQRVGATGAAALLLSVEPVAASGSAP
ncbi:MAG: hypothetical protein ACRETN_06280 [Nevskiales bacterium]